MANTLGGGWNNPDYGFDPQQALSGFGGLLGGLFNDSGKPYEKAAEQYQRYGDLATQPQQPYLQAGNAAIPQYQEWLQGQKDPSKFINDQMSNYQESPYAQNLQRQSLLAGQNAASASGLVGSTPMMQFLQQNAHDISSQDMNQWLQNVLGINTQYGQGQQNLMTGGQGAANQLTQANMQQGQNMANAAYGQQAGKNNNTSNMLGGIMSLLGAFL
jgi:hypothetical protein